jgi:hypothetical protein
MESCTSAKKECMELAIEAGLAGPEVGKLRIFWKKFRRNILLEFH